MLILELINEIIEFLPQVIEGLKMTIEIFLITLVLSIPLGILISIGMISKIKVVKLLTGIYVLVLRGTPLLLQILFIFFGLPLISINIPRFPAAIIAMVLN